MLPFRKQHGAAAFDEHGKAAQLTSAGSSRSRGPLGFKHVATISQEVHADLPFAGLLGVEVWRQVVVGVEPEVEPREGKGIDPTHGYKIGDRTF